MKLEIGDRVSIQHVADRYPGTVVDVLRGGRTVLVRPDNYEPAPGSQPMSNQWVITEGDTTAVGKFTLRRSGGYAAKGARYPFLSRGWSRYHSYEF